MGKVKMCPVCQRPFIPKRNEATCSELCSTAYSSRTYGKRALMRQAAEKKRRPVREDCRAYDPDIRDCTGLTGLWCEWEDCRFYKGGDEDVEEICVRERDLSVLP